MKCSHCDEEILPEEVFPGQCWMHLECATRAVVGSVGHQNRECSCYGKEDTSELGLTRREAAKAARERLVRGALKRGVRL